MWVSVDLCLLPLGSGLSISPYIAICTEIIEKAGLDYEINANGTALEGEWKEVFDCIRECHEAVHEKWVARIFTSLKINTRTDRKQSFREKVPSVKALISSET